MDFNLIRKEEEPKELLQVAVYSSIVRELEEIAKKENVKFTNLMRHCLNNFIAAYKEKGGKK